MSHTDRSTTPTQPTPPNSATSPPAAAAATAAQPRSDFDERGSVMFMTASPFMRNFNRHPALPSTSTAHAEPARDKEERARIKVEKEELRAQSDYKQMEADRIAEENLNICRKYFIVGCFGLPWVHFMTVWYFYREISGEHVNLKIRQYILLSIIIGLLQTFALILWFVIYRIRFRSSELSIIGDNDHFVGFLV